MTIIAKARGTGKTTELIKHSSIKNIPIICADIVHKNRIKEAAKKIGYDIPEPIIITTLLKSHSRNNGYLVDDLEYVFQTMINAQVNVAMMSVENLYVEPEPINIER